MDVVELLYELLMIANFEIVVALLPEVVSVSDQTPRHSLLQRLEGVRQCGPFGLADKQMDMFRHHDVSVDTKTEVAADALKGVLKDQSVRVGREQRATVITAERYEMALPGVLITLQAPGHEVSVTC